MMLVPVLLCGGVGSRLWPLSREHYPKQFLPLTSDLSLLAETLRRAEGIEGCSKPIIVCNDEHRFMVAEELRQLGLAPDAIILEPVGKNTAPALAVAALRAAQIGEASSMLVMPADHIIQDVDAFADAVKVGLAQAEGGKLVTFGIVPSAPETGYGYIRCDELDLGGCHGIAEFVEKPEQAVAESYIAEGNYLWNSGMFLMGVETCVAELQAYAPEIMSAASKAYQAAEKDLDFVRLDKAAFEACPSDSIDYAVMERTDKGVVVPLSCGWSDVGAWSTLWEVGDKDEQGNVVTGDVILHDAGDSYIHSSSRLVTALGVNNLVVVETADAVLVAEKDRVQDIKAIVSRLKSEQRGEVCTHTKVYRPWGSYESLVIADRFQVKRIIVNPGQRLSLQMHHHRAEHWIVVSGTAEVTRGDEVFVMSEDQSTYIPLGTKHRLANPGAIPLELIEVQSGSYLGEDDIVRFEDVYGRSS